jgi:hypothetical protein
MLREISRLNEGGKAQSSAVFLMPSCIDNCIVRCWGWRGRFCKAHEMFDGCGLVAQLSHRGPGFNYNKKHIINTS